MTARRKFRILLAALCACLVCVLAGLLVFSRRDAPTREAEQSAELAEACDADAILIRGFRQTVAEGMKTIYDLWAETATLNVATKEYSLRGVLPSSTYFGDEGRRVSFSADEGVYDAQSDNVFLKGNVTAMLGTGLALKCNDVTLSRSSMIATCDSPVVISGEGIYFQSRGFYADLAAKKILFDHGIQLISEASTNSIRDLVGTATGSEASIEAPPGKLSLKCDRMMVWIDQKSADLSGDVAFQLGDHELFAENVKVAWRDRLSDIDYGHLSGVVVARTKEATIGCSDAEYSEGTLTLKGEPFLIHEFDKLTQPEQDGDPNLRADAWPESAGAFDLHETGKQHPFLFGTREKFFLFRSAAEFLDCDTLSADTMRYTREPGQFLATGSVILTLGGVASTQQATGSCNQKIRAASLQSDLGTKETVFSGGVRLTADENSISSNTLRVTARPTDSGDLQLNSLVFDGEITAKAAAQAEEGDTSQAGKLRTMHLQCQRLEIDVDDGTALCSGAVSASSEDLALTCEELTLGLDDGMANIGNLEARRDVVLESQGRIATGGKLHYDEKQKTAVLTREPKIWYGDNVIWGRKVVYELESGNLSVVDGVKGLFYTKEGASDKKTEEHDESQLLQASESLRKPGKVELTADRLDFNQQTLEGSYTGAVVIRKGNAVFSAESVQMKGDPVSGKIETIEAQGDVRVQEGARVGRADRAVYNEAEQSVSLYGDPKVYEFEKVITTGEVITLRLGDRSCSIDGNESQRIKTTFFLPEH